MPLAFWYGESVCRVIGHFLFGHIDRSAVRVERNGVLVRRHLGAQRKFSPQDAGLINAVARLPRMERVTRRRIIEIQGIFIPCIGGLRMHQDVLVVIVIDRYGITAIHVQRINGRKVAVLVFQHDIKNVVAVLQFSVAARRDLRGDPVLPENVRI